jgi:hypothetical protein
MIMIPSSDPAGTTRYWIDMYAMVLDRLMEFLADPQKAAARMGITKEELEKQKQTAQLPGKMDMDAAKELMASWKNVRNDILLFGLTLGDDLMIAPDMSMWQSGTWQKNPWLEVSRENDNPLKFFGRDAMTAIGFFNFFIQQMDTVDPCAYIKKSLEAQGITKENFINNPALFGSSIRDPWADERSKEITP